jgi:hypothetical protein
MDTDSISSSSADADMGSIIDGGQKRFKKWARAYVASPRVSVRARNLLAT